MDRRPAEILGLSQELGTLRPGALADVALFALHRGRFPLYDVYMNVREGSQLLRASLTIVDGRPCLQSADEAPAPWIELTADQSALIQRGHTPSALVPPQASAPLGSG